MRQSRNAKTGMKFLSDRAATDDFAALENEGLESAFSEIKRGDECVVAATDEHDVLSDRHVQFFSLLCDEGEEESIAGSGSGAGWASVGSSDFGPVVRDAEADLAGRLAAAIFCQSLRITWLAMRPGAPMMPPPG